MASTLGLVALAGIAGADEVRDVSFKKGMMKVSGNGELQTRDAGMV